MFKQKKTRMKIILYVGVIFIAYALLFVPLGVVLQYETSSNGTSDIISTEKITLDSDEKFANEEFDEEVLHMRQMLKTKLVDMDLSVRALNCLKAADVDTLGDLVVYNKTDLLKFRNFGKKSLTELDDLLAGLNLTFGMDISKYKLDKE